VRLVVHAVLLQQSDDEIERFPFGGDPLNLRANSFSARLE
jgi:hypothetical protein